MSDNAARSSYLSDNHFAAFLDHSFSDAAGAGQIWIMQLHHIPRILLIYT